jgi:hypothetical protein
MPDLDQKRIASILGSTFEPLGSRSPVQAYIKGKAKMSKKAKRKPSRKYRARSRSLLFDLPGKPGATRAVNVRSITEAMRFISQGDPVTTAGGGGSLTVWRDNNGDWRAEFDRFRVPLDQRTLPTKGSIRKWLRRWWPKLGR